MNNRPASEIMTTSVITIRSDESISRFIDQLLKNGINGIPVVDNEGHLEGIATRTDLFAFELKRELETLYEKKIKNIFKENLNNNEWSSFEDMIGKFNRTITVNDIMTTNLITADENTPVKEICRTMKSRKINHIIVMKNNDIAGIITSRDIIGLVAGED